MIAPANTKQALLRWEEHKNLIQSQTGERIIETPSEKQNRIQRAKDDYAFFVSYYFPHYADAAAPSFHVKLARSVKEHKAAQWIIRWGRGLAKSVLCDITIPLWLWINGEPVYLLVIGNNEDKACILLSDVQAEFEANQRLIEDFGIQVTHGNWTSGHFVCKSNFIGKAIGMGQDARGLRQGSQRPNYIVADDLEDKDTLKNPKRQDEIVKWIERAIIPCMDGPIRRYLHPNNNFAPRTIQEELRKRHPSWRLNQVDACAPTPDRAPRWKEKYPPNYYKELEEAIGTIALEAEYNNKPFVEGSVFTPEMIQWAKPPRWDHFQFIVGRWDPAYSGKNDYNAVRVWGLYKHNFWLMKAFVRQCKMKEAIRWMFQTQKMLPAGVTIHWRVESQFWNDPVREAVKEVEQEMKETLNIVETESPKGKKLDRLISMHPYYQNGRTYWNENERASNDMQVGLAQLLGIEPGYKTHDDAPDADEQAISDLVKIDRVMEFEPTFSTSKINHSW